MAEDDPDYPVELAEVLYLVFGDDHPITRAFDVALNMPDPISYLRGWADGYNDDPVIMVRRDSQ